MTANWASRAAAIAAIAVGGAFLSPGAHAQEFPASQIEFVTYAGAGGGTDIFTRLAMQNLQAELGSPGVIVNKVGGAGAAAISYVASRPRDGNTVLAVTPSHALTLLRGAVQGLSMDDIVPLARGTDDPQVVMVSGKSPYQTIEDLVAAAKEKSFKFNAVPGSYDHMTMWSLARATGAQQFTTIPMSGGGDVLVSLVAGDIDVASLNFSEAEAQVTAGDIRPLLVLADERLPSLPDVPSAKEKGIDARASGMRGFAVMKGTPDDVVKKLEAALIASMSTPEYKAYLERTGQSPQSVVGSKEWGDILQSYTRNGEAFLKDIGVLK